MAEEVGIVMSLYDKELQQILKAALKELPEKQRSRVIAFYFEGLKKVDIAKRDGVDDSRICETIRRGLINLKKILNGQL